MENPISASRTRYKLVVSDFHLGKGRYFRDGTLNILEDFIYDKEFAEFLTYYRTGVYEKAEVELILNGDILNLLQIDTWGVHTHLMTERGVARAVERIVAGHPDFFQALRRFAATPGHFISYVVGNHDAGMLFQAPRRIFSEACGSEVQFFDVSHGFDGIHVEHGQQYESFARMDMRKPFITRGLPEPVLNLPWGSLFTAVALPRLKQQRPHVDKVRPLSTFVSRCLVHDPWWGMKAIAIIAKFVIDTVIFKTRYRISDGVKHTLSLLKEISVYPNYDSIAGKILAERNEVHTVIFGHTHILRYRRWSEAKQYFNEGTWNEVTNLDIGEYGTRTRLTYAFIEYPMQASESSPGTDLGTGAARPRVRLKEWHGVWHPESEVLA